MKIITLNTWGGRAGKEKLLNFFQTYKDDVDAFCLQEIWSAPYEHLEGAPAGGKSIVHDEIMTQGLQDISVLLSNYVPYFRPHHLDNYGLLTLIKNTCNVIQEDEVFVYKEKGYIPVGSDVGRHARNIQYIQTMHNNSPLILINFHGLWNGGGKTDSEDRLVQSKKIVEFIKLQKGEIIFCGDFNLLPDTQSIQILEHAGLRNLVTEYNVTSTRTSFYTKPEKFADYILVSKGVEVKDFKVLQDEVSDHSPLYLEIA